MSGTPRLALSVRQPWAWAIIHGGKDIENRSWQAVNHGLNQRGRIAIHASQGMTRYEYESAQSFMRRLGVDCPRPDELLRGAIIGSVNVVDVVTEHDSPWFFGPRGLVLDDPKPITPLGHCSGALGYFEWRETNEPLAQPKPWMTAWPGDASKKREPSPMDLFKAKEALPND